MAAYLTLTSPRVTVPDTVALLVSLRAIDATAGYSSDGVIYRVKTATIVSPGNVNAMQAAIDTAPALTQQRQAQNEIDQLSISQRALVLALIDAINVLRTHPAIGLPAVTPAQALTAIRNKAGTL